MVLNFQNGTVYRNVGPSATGVSGYDSAELLLAMDGGGRSTLISQAKTNGSGDYRWDLFYRAIKGEEITGEIPFEQMVAGIKIVKAMSEALRTGHSVRVV
jgi:hypothetical protein